MEPNSRNEWVAGRLAATKPEWDPNLTWARTRLHGSMETPRHRRGWAAAALAAAAMLTIFVALPQGSMLAQDLLFRWFVRSFDVVRLDLSRIPMKASIASSGGGTALNLDEAERLAGYRPILPSHQVVGGAPTQIFVTGSIGIQQRVSVREFREALEAAGAGELQVPLEWEGVTLRTDIAPLVIAGYPGEIQVVQSKPMELKAPAGFPLARLAEAAFRCAGVSAPKARAMGEKYAANPAWLLDVPEDEVIRVEEIRMGMGSALLFEEPTEQEAERITVLFSTDERVFAVIGNSRERCIRIANSLL
jgi:hypothetical protein